MLVVPTELLTTAILDAHMRTCLYTDEQIDDMRAQTTSPELLDCLRNMVRACGVNEWVLLTIL